MTVTYVLVTLLAAAVMGWAASADATRPGWLTANMARLEVPPSRLPVLGTLKAAGALGLVVGLALPPVGVAAAAGLVLFFLGAIVTVLRARWWAHWYPVPFLALAAASLALRLATW